MDPIPNAGAPGSTRLTWGVKTGGSIFVAAMGVSFLKRETQGSKSWVALCFEAEAEVSRASSVVDGILICGGRILKRGKGVESPPQAGKLDF